MSGRAKGYHYAIGSDGKKHRIYSKRSMAGSISGHGSYKINRNRPLRGRGGYYDSNFVKFMNKNVPKGSFKAMGKTVGGPLGGLLGAGLSQLAGFGEYTVKSNSLALSEGESPARMHSNSANTSIRHREYITDIVSSPTANTFQLQSFPINVGLNTVFPWLAAVAQQYQEWVPKGLVFEFKSLSADAVASSQANMTIGGVIMSTNYNSASPNFPNKQSMDNTEYTTSCKPSESFYHPVECAPKENVLPELYIRDGAVPAGQDQKTYDLGNFQIATFGIASTSVVLGELWVSYDIELRKPISTSALGADVLTDHFQLGTVANATPLGTTSSLQAGSSIGGTITNSGTTYNFNPLLQEGTFMFFLRIRGGANISPIYPAFTFNNCKALTIVDPGGGSIFPAPGGGSTTSTIILACLVQITAMNANIVLATGGTLVSGFSYGDLIITQFDYNINT